MSTKIKSVIKENKSLELEEYINTYTSSPYLKEAVNKLIYETKKKNIQETAEKNLVWEEQKGEVMKALKINA